ncbi:hypothetical protein PFISCL1PPCAC_10501, partial [Pristionchus fissidentatus]
EESSVESDRSIGASDLDEAVNQSVEFAGSGLSDVSSQAGTGKIERVDEAERGCSGSSSGSKVSGEELPEVLLLVKTLEEDLLVSILEGEVQSLGGEVTDDIGEISSPESGETLLLGDSHEHINDALVTLVFCDGARCVLHLKEELDTLDGGDSGLGDGSGRSSGGQIDKELLGIETLCFFGHYFSLCRKCCKCCVCGRSTRID